VRGRRNLTLEPLGPLVKNWLLVCRRPVKINIGSRLDLHVDDSIADDTDVLHRFMAHACLSRLNPAINLRHEVLLGHWEASCSNEVPKVIDPTFCGVRDDEILLLQTLAKFEQELLTLRCSHVKSIV